MTEKLVEQQPRTDVPPSGFFGGLGSLTKDAFRDAFLQRMGSKKAGGRLLFRQHALNVQHNFDQYLGFHGHSGPVTDDDIRGYIQKTFPQAASAMEPIIQQITGVQPQTQTQQQTQTPAQQTLPLQTPQTTQQTPQQTSQPTPQYRQQTLQQQQLYGQLRSQLSNSAMRGGDPNFMNNLQQFMKNAQGTKLEPHARKFYSELLRNYPDMFKRPTRESVEHTNQEQWWVMAAIDNALRTTQRGTAQRHEIVATLRGMQHDPRIIDKIPQLTHIQRESHDKVFDLAVYLVENQISNRSDLTNAYYRIICEATPLNTQQVNQIIWNLANQTADMFQPNQQQQQQQGQQQQQQSTRQTDILNTVITRSALNSVSNNRVAQYHQRPEDWALLMNTVSKQDQTVDQILRQLGDRTHLSLMPTLLLAARATR